MRVFYALEFESKDLDQIEMVQKELSTYCSSCRIMDKDSFHMTLCFIGEVNEERLDDLKGIMDSNTYTKETMIFDHIGFFKIRNKYLYYLGGKENNVLRNVSDGLRSGLDEKKIQHADTPFKPHITLLRNVKEMNEEKLNELNDRLSKNPLKFNVYGIQLYKSNMDHTGSIYDVLYDTSKS